MCTVKEIFCQIKVFAYTLYLWQEFHKLCSVPYRKYNEFPLANIRHLRALTKVKCEYLLIAGFQDLAITNAMQHVGHMIRTASIDLIGLASTVLLIISTLYYHKYLQPVTSLPTARQTSRREPEQPCSRNRMDQVSVNTQHSSHQKIVLASGTTQLLYLDLPSWLLPATCALLSTSILFIAWSRSSHTQTRIEGCSLPARTKAYFAMWRKMPRSQYYYSIMHLKRVLWYLLINDFYTHCVICIISITMFWSRSFRLVERPCSRKRRSFSQQLYRNDVNIQILVSLGAKYSSTCI